MLIDVAISASSIVAHPLLAQMVSDHIGASAEFRGIVRREENDGAIEALEYEAYRPMAENTMRAIIQELGTRHPCDHVIVVHRVGIVPVGEAAIIVQAHAKHRGEALALVSGFMDRLKLDVPIWKLRSVPLLAKATLPQAKREPPGYAESLAIIGASCQALTTERIPLAQASGRVLRETITAPEDQPAFDRSAVDGIAIRLDDPSENFAVVDEIRAGAFHPRVLQIGEAVRISTGAAVPGENLQVIMIEDVVFSGHRCRVIRRQTDTYIRKRGEVVKRGDTLRAEGSRLSPGALSLLASIGHTEPLVTRQLKIAHFTTGDEIVPPDCQPGRGQIRDSNSILVQAFCAKLGVATTHRHLSEDLETAKSQLAHHPAVIDSSDILLFSGGASVGTHDHTLELLAHLGFALKIRGTRLRPGKPLLFGTEGSRLAFGLPGNPLAHYVGLVCFIGAAIATLTGLPAPSLQAATLTAPLQVGNNSRETLWPALLSHGNGCLKAEPLSWNNSGDLVALSRANGLILLAPGTGLLDRDTSIDVLIASPLL